MSYWGLCNLLKGTAAGSYPALNIHAFIYNYLEVDNEFGEWLISKEK